LLHLPPNNPNRLAVPGGLIPLLLTVALALAAPLQAQGDLWENLIRQGNQALDAGAPAEAAVYYRRALLVSHDFAVSDLRCVTAFRNLGHVQALQGNHSDADTLYAQAIAAAHQILEKNHPYLIALIEERERIQWAMRQEPSPADTTLAPPLGLAALLRLWAITIARNASFQPGAIVPLSPTLADNFQQGFVFGLGIHLPLWDWGFLKGVGGLEYIDTRLASQRLPFYQPIRVSGVAFTLVPSLGPVGLLIGAGGYKTGPADRRQLHPGVVGGVTLRVKRPGSAVGHLGIQTTLFAKALQVMDSDAKLFLLAGIGLGYRW